MKKIVLGWLNSGFVTIKLTGDREAMLIFDSNEKALKIAKYISGTQFESGAASVPIVHLEFNTDREADLIKKLQKEMTGAEAEDVEIIFESNPLFQVIFDMANRS